MFKNLFNKVKNIFSSKKNEETSTPKEEIQNVDITDKGTIVVSGSNNQIHGRKFRQESGASVTVIDPRQVQTTVSVDDVVKYSTNKLVVEPTAEDAEGNTVDFKGIEEVKEAVKKVSGKYSNTEIEVIKEALKGKETFTLVDVEALAKTMGRDVRSLRTKINSITK